MAQYVPDQVPTEEMLRWGAEVFDKRGGFIRYSGGTALRVHSTDVGTLSALRDTFGGRVQPASSTYRWLIYGRLLEAFLGAIQPLLPAGESAELAERALEKVGQEQATRGQMGRPPGQVGSRGERLLERK